MSTKKGRGLSGSEKKRTPTRSKKGRGSATRGVQKRPRVVSGVSAGASEETRAKLDSLQSEFGGLQKSLLLTGVHDEMGDIETALSVLPAEIEALRTRGYVFRSFLENKLDVLAGQWGETRDRVSREIDRRVRELERESDEAEAVLRRAAASGRAAEVSRAESAVNTLERKASAAQSAVEAMYQNLQENVNQTRSQVEQIGWLLDQVDEASFQLYPAEDPVMACKAQFMETKKEGPEGVLYLTDERLIFERKEEVATKKVLFITTEKEKVQETVFEVPVGQVEEIKSAQKGFLGRKEMLELLLAPEADLSEATLRLHGADNEEWAGMIGRVKSGEIAKERTKPKDEAAVEAARTAPTKCPTCGATLSVEIVRGMREINCTYCGSVIRL
jgi:predicted  nucleic acid-binding Zn-ribbon protein